VQIRIANRQDEPEIRTFVESIYKASGSSFEIETKDADLRNIEANYFGKEGLLLVAEHENKIVGLAGAKKKSESVLEIKRLIGSSGSGFDQAEMLSELITVIVEFAPRLLYERVETDLVPASNAHEKLFAEKGFESNNGNDSFALDVQQSGKFV